MLVKGKYIGNNPVTFKTLWKGPFGEQVLLVIILSYLYLYTIKFKCRNFTCKGVFVQCSIVTCILLQPLAHILSQTMWYNSIHNSLSTNGAL